MNLPSMLSHTEIPRFSVYGIGCAKVRGMSCWDAPRSGATALHQLLPSLIIFALSHLLFSVFASLRHDSPVTF